MKLTSWQICALSGPIQPIHCPQQMRIWRVCGTAALHPEHHNLAKLHAVWIGKPVNPQISKMRREQLRATLQLCLRYHEHQHSVCFQPAVGVLQEQQFEAFVSLRPRFKVVRRIQVQHRQRLGRAPNLKQVRMQHLNSKIGGLLSPMRVDLHSVANRSGISH